jgi:putative transposase
MKVLYLVAITKRENRENMSGKINGWKRILNVLTVHYGDRAANHI